MSERASLPVFDDERGRLIPVEFSELPFAPQRCFVVTAPGRAVDRGGHRADCRQILVLLQGSARVRLVSNEKVTEHQLLKPGSSILVEATDHIDYHLACPGTGILVLAEAPYVARTE